MTTKVYAITFKSGKRCTCICMEEASDAENEESIRNGFCGNVATIERVRSKEDE